MILFVKYLLNYYFIPWHNPSTSLLHPHQSSCHHPHLARSQGWVSLQLLTHPIGTMHYVLHCALCTMHPKTQTKTKNQKDCPYLPKENLQFRRFRVSQEGTNNKQTNITTYLMNRHMGRFSENSLISIIA